MRKNCDINVCSSKNILVAYTKSRIMIMGRLHLNNLTAKTLVNIIFSNNIFKYCEE